MENSVLSVSVPKTKAIADQNIVKNSCWKTWFLLSASKDVLWINISQLTWHDVANIPSVCLCPCQVDSSVFESRELVQRLAFGLSFLQRMDMKPVVVMGRSECEEMGPNEPVAGSRCTQGLVERSQQLTEALQQHSATVLPLFSAESFLLLHEAPHGIRWLSELTDIPVWGGGGFAHICTYCRIASSWCVRAIRQTDQTDCCLTVTCAPHASITCFPSLLFFHPCDAFLSFQSLPWSASFSPW